MISVDWNQVTSRREQALLGVVCVGLCLFFLRALVFPQIDQIGVSRAQYKTLVLERDVLAKFLKTTPSLEQAALSSTQASPKFKVLAGGVKPSAGELTDLLPQLTDPAFLQGVHMEGLSFQSPFAEMGFSRTDFILEVSGNFAHLVQYLERLEGYPALFLIRDVALNVPESSRVEVKAEITCRFFKRNGAAAKS